MTVLLGAADVEAACDMTEIVSAVEQGLKEEAAGDVVMPPRLNLDMGEGFFRIMPVVMNGAGLMGFKAFHGSMKKGARYLIAVYRQEQGELLALLDANYLTAARTGATTGVATKFQARSDAHVVAVIGSGLEAGTNLAAVCAVRNIDEVRVFSPREERRHAFATRVRDQHGIEANAVDDPLRCVQDADVVVVATNTNRAPDPIAFRGAWMNPGMHVNTIGSTTPKLREVDTQTFKRADVLVVDSAEQVCAESGDVLAALAESVYPRATELCKVVSGEAEGRRGANDVTVFKSVGTAVQDVAAGFAVYEAALRLGLGRDVGEFLELKII